MTVGARVCPNLAGFRTEERVVFNTNGCRSAFIQRGGIAYPGRLWAPPGSSTWPACANNLQVLQNQVAAALGSSFLR